MDSPHTQRGTVAPSCLQAIPGIAKSQDTAWLTQYKHRETKPAQPDNSAFDIEVSIEYNRSE